MIEPYIAQTLRNYLSRVGHRDRPVACTAKQIDDLKKADLIHVDIRGVIRFEGQELAVHQELESDKELRELAGRVDNINTEN